MSKKKTPKSVFYGSAGGFFSQKKKVILGNVKHSGNERNISLSNSGPSNNIYSDVKSLFGDDEDVNMSGVNNESFLGSAATTSKTNMDDNEVVLFLYLPISLDKKWIDPKIIKTLVEVSIKKLFALDINFSAVEEKLAIAKTQLSMVLGRATTFSKFERIIKSTFTSKISIMKTTSLAKENGIITNVNIKKQGIHSNQAVVIKKIIINMPKEIIKAIVEFAKSGQAEQLTTKWSFLISKNSVHVAKVVRDCDTWASRDWFKALLFTLSIETTAYDLGTLLDRAGKKTCVINCLLDFGNQICCTIIGFESKESLESAYRTELIFGGIKLSWARLDLVYCEKCEHFGHSALKCDALTASVSKSSKTFKKITSEVHHLQLIKLYVKKSVFIFCSAVFVVFFALFSGGFHIGYGSGSGSSLLSASYNKESTPVAQNDLSIDDCLALLECSLELLTKQVLDIVYRLNSMELVLLVPVSQIKPLVIPAFMLSMSDANMVLDIPQPSFPSLFPIIEDKIVDLGISSLKVLTSKVGCLESKIVALEVFIGLILGKLNLLYMNLGFLIYYLFQ
ncbi:hypothetical protein G9A89_002915 [Geosiphon pyriformis]|nr:hypothetical protein G9A89_002915 [Geosiphon pyriformis]